ncbi:2-iminoacetate synthase ThiH, partial [Candidatus Termititenax aidoneus]
MLKESERLMQYINEALIWEILEQAQKTTPDEIEKILQKSRKLQRLTL